MLVHRADKCEVQCLCLRWSNPPNTKASFLVQILGTRCGGAPLRSCCLARRSSAVPHLQNLLFSLRVFFFFKKRSALCIFALGFPWRLEGPSIHRCVLCLLCFETVASWHHCTDYSTTSARLSVPGCNLCRAGVWGEKASSSYETHSIEKLQRVGHVSVVRITCDTCTCLPSQPSPYRRSPSVIEKSEKKKNAATMDTSWQQCQNQGKRCRRLCRLDPQKTTCPQTLLTHPQATESLTCWESDFSLRALLL